MSIVCVWIVRMNVSSPNASAIDARAMQEANAAILKIPSFIERISQCSDSFKRCLTGKQSQSLRPASEQRKEGPSSIYDQTRCSLRGEVCSARFPKIAL